MEEWIQNVLSSDQAGITVLAAVFLFGILSVFSCGCNFTLIGMAAGYSGSLGSTGRTRAIIMNGVFFLVGMIISMAAIGAIIGYASELINLSFGKYWRIAAGVVSIFFGLLTMEVLPFKLPGITINPSSKKGGTLSSIIFGLTVGGLTLACSGCCNPVFPIIVAVSFVKGSTLWGILLMLAYALGYGLTFALIIIGVGLGFGKTSKTFKTFGNVLKYGGGILMIAIGFYLLITL